MIVLIFVLNLAHIKTSNWSHHFRWIIKYGKSEHGKTLKQLPKKYSKEQLKQQNWLEIKSPKNKPMPDKNPKNVEQIVVTISGKP